MKHLNFALAFALFTIVGCGPDPDTTGTPADENCSGELNYRLTISNSDGEVVSMNAAEYDAEVRNELGRLKSFIWGLAIEGTRGIARVELGLPGSTCSATWTITNVFPAEAPGSLIFNTGEPLLTGHRWEQSSLTGLATFPSLTVEGELTTRIVRENFELLLRIYSPPDDAGEQCIIDHMIPFTVVK